MYHIFPSLHTLILDLKLRCYLLDSFYLIFLKNVAFNSSKQLRQLWMNFIPSSLALALLCQVDASRHPRDNLSPLLRYTLHLKTPCSGVIKKNFALRHTFQSHRPLGNSLAPSSLIPFFWAQWSFTLHIFSYRLKMFHEVLHCSLLATDPSLVAPCPETCNCLNLTGQFSFSSTLSHHTILGIPPLPISFCKAPSGIKPGQTPDLFTFQLYNPHYFCSIQKMVAIDICLYYFQLFVAHR